MRNYGSSKLARSLLLHSNVPSLTCHHYSILDSDQMLDDDLIACYQNLLKVKFPHINGLYHPFVVGLCSNEIKLDNFVQILHTNTNHWVCVSYTDGSIVNLFDSMRTLNIYKHVGQQTLHFFHNDCDKILFKVYFVQQQKGTTDCGLFAAAFATAICFGHDPTLLNFDQDSMRRHFKQCITSKNAEMFPYSQKRSSSRRQDALIVPYERIQDYKPPPHSLK